MLFVLFSVQSVFAPFMMFALSLAKFSSAILNLPPGSIEDTFLSSMTGNLSMFATHSSIRRLIMSEFTKGKWVSDNMGEYVFAYGFDIIIFCLCECVIEIFPF